MTRPNRSSVRKAIKDRQCDDCGQAIPTGTSYFAQEPDFAGGLVGPHVGWSYWCLPDAARRGVIAPSISEETN